MLTNIYYYNFYKPYIISNHGTGGVTERRDRIAEKHRIPEQNEQIILNKAQKTETVRYARNVSYSVNHFKLAVNGLMYNIDEYAQSRGEQRDRALEHVTESLQQVSDTYNRGTRFMREQPHSPRLRTYSYELGDIFHHHRNSLERIGYTMPEGDTRINFDRAKLRSMPREEVQWAIATNMPAFNSLRRSATDVLREPLSEHMNFKGLGYYYNYKMGTIMEDGFGAIESGMLLNIAV
jgi:hypothetical protein